MNDILARIEHNTQHHPPLDNSIEDAHMAVRAAAREFMRAVAAFAPECREASLALTKAEEAMMWANAAIARNQDRDSGERP